VATVPSRRNRSLTATVPSSEVVGCGGGVWGGGAASIASRQPVVEPEVIVLIQYYSSYSVLYRLVGRLGFSSKG